MNILDYLDEKHKKVEAFSHPLENIPENIKFFYCFGIATMALGHKKHFPDAEQAFFQHLKSIKLDLVMQEKLLDSIDTNFEYKMNEVFEYLNTKDYQYCFISDLLKISYSTSLSQVFCQDIILGFIQVFGFSKEEKTFLLKFSELANAFSKEEYSLSSYNNIEEAKQLYCDFIKTGHFISYRILKYIFPSFEYTQQFDSIILDQGNQLILDTPLKINGNIVIKNCSTLILDHTTAQINGTFFVEKGKILIKNSDIKIENSNIEKDFLFSISDTPLITIENSTIDCNLQTAFLTQDSGCLQIRHSHIKNTKGKRGIVFSGKYLEISHTTFENCLDGAILNSSTRETTLHTCRFLHCSSEHGGAIYSNSLYDTTIENCVFEHCNANFIGGAIYFVNKRYSQRVVNCTFHHCYPKDSLVFNPYDHSLLYTSPK